MRALAITVLWVTAGLAAQAPMTRARVEPAGPVTPGQSVRLVADVLVPTWFTGAPRWPEIEIPGALTIRPEARTINWTESIDGSTWSAQTREYFVCPLRPGRFEIEPFDVVVRYSVDGKPSSPTSVATPAVGFDVEIPEAARDTAFYVTSPSFQLKERLTPNPAGGLKVGDSLQREITMTAEGTFALFLPPLQFDGQEGFSSYPAAPALTDRGGERGDPRIAERKESVTLVFEKAGDYTLPALSIPWWNVTEEKVEVARLEAIDLTVAPNPELSAAELGGDPADSAEGAPEQADSFPWEWLAYAALAIALIIQVSSGLPAKLRDRRATAAASEPAFFRRFEKACQSEDLRETARALQKWLDRTGWRTARAFSAAWGDRRLQAAVEAIDASLFGRGGDAPTSELAAGMHAARKRWLKSQRAASVDALAPLNPRPAEFRRL